MARGDDLVVAVRAPFRLHDVGLADERRQAGRWAAAHDVDDDDGVSVNMPRPMFSCMRLKPGPEVAVIVRSPVHEAPRMQFMLAISSSIWMKRPPTSEGAGRGVPRPRWKG